MRPATSAIKTLPKSFNQFHRPQFQNDKTSKSIADFLSCPSFALLTDIIHLEAKAWHTFAHSPSSVFDKRRYLLRQIDQRSCEREPNERCKDFLPTSYVCRILYEISLRPPRYYHSEDNVDFGALFQNIRKLPHFSRNLIHEIITYCNLGNVHYAQARRAQKYLANPSWKTYQSALNQLASHFNISFDNMYIQILQNPSPISDLSIYNFLIHAVDSKRWLRNRSVAILCGLKKITQVNASRRFDTQFWKETMSEIKRSGLSKRTKHTALIEEKDFSTEFGIHIWLQAKQHGTIDEAAVCQFLPLTGQRPTDYDNFLPTDGTLQIADLRFRALWSWGKGRDHEFKDQFSYIPFGTPGSFYDIQSCWNTLISHHSPKNTYLLRYKNTSNKLVTAEKIVKKFAMMVPLKFQSFPAQDISLYFYKNMMADFLSRTNNLHPQVGAHYLKHTIKNPNSDFVKNTKNKFGHKAFMWFTNVSMRYCLKVNHIPKIRKEFQRIWNDILTQELALLQSHWQQLGFSGEFLAELKNFNCTTTQV